MYFFFKYGFKATIVRIRYYNEYLTKRVERAIRGEQEEDIVSEFLTEEAKLSIEIEELSSEEGYAQPDDSERGYRVIYDR